MPDKVKKVVTAAVAAAVADVESPLAVVALKVAARLDDPETPSKDVAGLSRELRQLLTKIDDLSGVDVDPIDELAAKREARTAG